MVSAVSEPLVLMPGTYKYSSPDTTCNVGVAPLTTPLPLTVNVPGMPVTVAEPPLAMSL